MRLHLPALLALAASVAPASAAVDPASLGRVAYAPGGLAYWDRPYLADAMLAGGGWVDNWAPVPVAGSPQFDARLLPRYLDPGQTLTAILNGLHVADGTGRPAGWTDTSTLFRGKWTVTWRGTADVRLAGGACALVDAESSGPATGSLADGRRTYQCDTAPGWLSVSVIDAPLTDLHAWMPDPADPAGRTLEGQLFHPSLLQRIAQAPWSWLRFMDWSATNASPQRDWVDRRLVAHAFQDGVLNPRPPATGFPGDRATGIAWEHVVALGNATGRDIWINVPHMATDDYVTKLAQLIRFGSDGADPYTSPQPAPLFPPLAPGRRVFVEYSNEIWSAGNSFAQGEWATEQATLRGISKAQFNARRASEIWSLFQQVFGGTQDLVRVAAVFTANESYTRPFLEEMRAYGPALAPPAEPDVVAGTTYFGNGIQDWAQAKAVAEAGGADPWFLAATTFDAGGGNMRPVSLPPGDPYWTSASFERHLDETYLEWTRRMLSGSTAQGGGPDATGFGGGFDASLVDLARTTFASPLPLVAYEGGPSLYTDYMDGGDPRDDGVTMFMEALNRREGMYGMYRMHLEMAHSKGLRTHAAFVDCSAWGKYGQWGHLESLDQPDAQAPKWRALLDWLADAGSLRPVDEPQGAVPQFDTAAVLPVARWGDRYAAGIVTSGGDGARAVTVLGGTLPRGLAVTPDAGDPSSVRIEGIPDRGGWAHVYLRVTDADGDAAWRIFAVYVAGEPGTLIESDFRGTSPALALPWTAYHVKAPRVDAWSGWSAGPGVMPRDGDDAITFSVNAPGGTDGTLDEAIADGEHLTATLQARAGRALDLRGARVRLAITRIDYHAPRRFAVFTSVGGFAPGQEVFASGRDTDMGTPQELAFDLPQDAAYSGLAGPVEIRIVPFAAQWGGHRAALSAFRILAITSPPIAAFTVTPGSPVAGAAADFDASSSSDPDGDIAEWIWDFGDGATGSGVTASHAFARAGTYPVTLRVRDDLLAMAAAVQDVVVTSSVAPPGEASDVIGGAAPLLIAKGAPDERLAWAPPLSGDPPDEYLLYGLDVLALHATREPACEAALGGGTAATLPLPSGRAFLVVARNAGGEGGYGRDSQGADRARAAAGACP